jgi:hypothetical protein
MKKKIVVRSRKASPRRVSVRSKKWALLVVLILLLTIPMTMALIAQSQDIRQDAATTYVNSTQITTMPTDTLKISISKEDGTTQESNGSQKKSSQGTDGQEDEDQSGGSGECTKEETREVTEGGTKTNININCDGQNQTANKSGTDGSNNVVNRSGGQEQTVTKSKTTKKKTTAKKKSKKKSKGLVQRFLDSIRNRQARN